MLRPPPASTRLLLLLLLAAALAAVRARSPPGLVLHVAPNGSDASAGTDPAQPLQSCAGAMIAIGAFNSSVPAGGIEVRFASGTYPLRANTTCGTLQLKGTEERPVVLRAVGSVTFDGGAHLDATGLSAVTNATVLPLLNPSAKTKIKVLHVPGGNGTWNGGDLSWNGKPLTSSRWPNTGQGYVRKVLDPGAVYTDGRTKGPRPHCSVCQGDNKSTAAAPCGANISLLEQPTGNWQAELEAGDGFGSLSLNGYLAADWYHETHHIARVHQTATNTSLQFASFSRYGICEALEMGGAAAGPHCPAPEHAPPKRTKCLECIGDCRTKCAAAGCCYSNSTLFERCYKAPPPVGPPPPPAPKCAGSAPGRFVVTGLLSEVDSPGEYFWDGAARNLYLYPLDDSEDVQLSFKAGPGLVALTSATWVTVRGFTIIGAGGTVFSITGGENNTIGGNTISNCGGGVVLAGGYRNRVIGNDILDVGTHIATSGNDHDGFQNLVPTNNVVANSEAPTCRPPISACLIWPSLPLPPPPPPPPPSRVSPP
jgi:parallel beta-helix repeat protein